ncbi:tetratricopeptide repeat protein [Shewanella sp. Isolate13]|uniref:tetratricopeptide repeat protein n=1 Tax=Shewanella sp. Isolate13 TaxID=2908531 RepID=UPI001EFDDB1F|nr:tetratricopeptide repeat protein [Shewanella sp. Isolate13]MCG9730298.1 tetratricopeptide repeat protein [Shewanella sp. Isolate13]
MSVINKMLKDLDERQQPHGIESMTAPQLAFKPKTSSKRALLLTSIVSLAVGGLVMFYGLTVFQADKAVASNLQAATSEVVKPQSTPAELVTPEAESRSESEPSAPDSIVSEAVVSPAQASEAIQAKVTHSEPAASEDSRSIVPTVAVATDTEQASTSANTGRHQLAKNESQQASEVTEEPQVQTLAKTQVAVNSSTVQVVQSQPKPAMATKLNIAPATNRSKQLHNSGNMAVKEVKLSPEELAQKQMLLATDAQQQGLHRDALTYYEAALAYDPSLHQARRQAAALYYGQSKLAKAAKLLEQGQLLFPQEYEFSLLLARVQQAGGQAEQALKNLAKIPDNSVLAIKKWHQQSDLAQAQKDYPVAEQSFRQLAKYEPSQGRWWMGLGYSLDAQQKYTEAKAAYSQALSQGNLSAQAKVYVDNRLLQLGAY